MRMAAEMQARLGLTDWEVKIVTGARRRLGQTLYDQKLVTLTAWYVDLNDTSEIRDTLAHEFAHAIVGPGHRHGPKWKAVARSLGATPRARATGIKSLPARLIATCEYCSQRFYRERQPRLPRLCRCTRGMTTRPVLRFVPYRPAVSAARLKNDDPTGQTSMTNGALTALLRSLKEAQDAGDRVRGRQVRAQLRCMGHRGGLRSAGDPP